MASTDPNKPRTRIESVSKGDPVRAEKFNEVIRAANEGNNPIGSVDQITRTRGNAPALGEGIAGQTRVFFCS